MLAKLVHSVKSTTGYREYGLNLGPFGVRAFKNRFGWGVTVWLGKLALDLSWDT